MNHSAVRAFPITPDDGGANGFPSGVTYAQRLFVGGAGNVKITTPYGDTVTYTGVLAGTYLFVEALKIFATGTTATNIVGEYIRAQ
jgi:hypothetical protein